MFDQKQQSNNNGLNQGKNSPSEPVFDDRHLSGIKGPVEDILSGTKDPTVKLKPESSPPPSDKPELKDIPTIPSMSQQSTATSAAPSKATTPDLSNFQTMPNLVDDDSSKQTTTPRKKSKVFFVIIIVLIIAVVSLAAYFAYQYFSKSSITNWPYASPADFSSNDLTNEEKSATDESESNQTSEEENSNLEPEDGTPPYPYLPPDTDGDGLADEVEIDLGTNPNQFDTDNDNLNDFEEVEIYHSDPINSDTDGDGYLDGAEVESGYSPIDATTGAKLFYYIYDDIDDEDL